MSLDRAFAYRISELGVVRADRFLKLSHPPTKNNNIPRNNAHHDYKAANDGLKVEPKHTTSLSHTSRAGELHSRFRVCSGVRQRNHLNRCADFIKQLPRLACEPLFPWGSGEAIGVGCAPVACRLHCRADGAALQASQAERARSHAAVSWRLRSHARQLLRARTLLFGRPALRQRIPGMLEAVRITPVAGALRRRPEAP